MKFTLEEMNILSTKLEKERSEIYNQQNVDQNGDGIHHLEVISHLQQRLEDQETELYAEEQQYLASLIQEEIEHIHGDGVEAYQSILDKIQNQ